MCRVLRVSRSGFYKYKHQSSSLSEEKKKKLFKVREVFASSRQTYGSRRVAVVLKRQGIRCNKNQIAKLMSENGLIARGRRKYKVTTDSDHRLPVAPNLVNRNFALEKKNKVWVGDITYIWTREGWLYLSTVIDLYSRKIVSWSLSKRMTKQIVTGALQDAIQTRKPEAGLIFHSDQGSQYASNEFRNILSSINAQPSMSRRGNCWDNAVAESFFKTIKTEFIRWENFQSRREAELKIFSYIEIFYNRQRLHSTNGYLSPVEYEEQNHV